MMAVKCYIKKDDKVKVIAGRDKGKIGKVLKVDRKKGGLLIEKINIVKRHSKPTQQKANLILWVLSYFLFSSAI